MKRALRDDQDSFDIKMLNLKPYKRFFYPMLEPIDDVKKLKSVQNDLAKVQNKSKLVTVNPIFN